MWGAQNKTHLTETTKPTPPFSTAGIPDELEYRGRTSPFWGGAKQKARSGGDLSEDAELSAGVSHVERHNLSDTNEDDLTGVTTTPCGKRREQCERQSKDELTLFDEEHIIHQQMEVLTLRYLRAAAAQAGARAEAAEKEHTLRQRMEILIQRYLHAAAGPAEARAAAEESADRARAAVARARAESDEEVARERLLHQHWQKVLLQRWQETLETLKADRQLTAARAAADRAREESDLEVARERLLLQHRQEALNSQRYLAGNITERSHIPGHGGDAQPMPNDRHDHVATEGGAHMRGEQKITSRNTQDQSSTAGRLGGGLNLPQDSGGLNAQHQSSTAGQFGGGFCYSPRPWRTFPNQDPCATDPRGCFTKRRCQVYFKNKEITNQH